MPYLLKFFCDRPLSNPHAEADCRVVELFVHMNARSYSQLMIQSYTSHLHYSLQYDLYPAQSTKLMPNNQR